MALCREKNLFAASVNILIAFSNTIRASADSLIVSADAIRLFFALSELLVNKKRMYD